MGDTVSEFEEFLNWRKGRESSQRQEGLLGEIRDSLAALGKAIGPAAPAGDADKSPGDGDGTPPAPPARATPKDTPPATDRPSRWFGTEAAG